jgi:hypothetical protein
MSAAYAPESPDSASMPGPRYAISFTPPPDSPLAVFGASVIGYDCFERAEVPRRLIDGINPSVLALATVEPRRYGFRATLVAPFRLATGVDEDAITQAFLEFSASHVPVDMGLLQVTAMRRSVVLSPVASPPESEALADACVTAFDRYRARLAEAGSRALRRHGAQPTPGRTPRAPG